MKIKLSKEEIDCIVKDDSKSLAARVVVFRMLNSFREEAKVAMAELMKRRQLGEIFDFETFIETQVKENSIDLKIPSFNNLKRNFMEKSIYNLMSGIINEKDNNEDDDDDDEEEEEIVEPKKEFTKEEIKKQKDLETIVETIAEILSRP